MAEKHITQMTLEEFAIHINQSMDAYTEMANDPSSELYGVLKQSLGYLALMSFSQNMNNVSLSTSAFMLGMLCEREGWYIPNESLQPPAEQ